NYGALACLKACLELLGREGFVLLNDYGPVDLAGVGTSGTFARFGGSIALGLNFPLLEKQWTADGCAFLTPPGDAGRGIHARLLGRRVPPPTARAFQEHFAADALEEVSRLAQQGRERNAAGQHLLAFESYRAALACHPRNWCVLGEMAELLGQKLGKPEAA